MKRYIAIARPDHWIKNVFMLPGIIFAYIVGAKNYMQDYSWSAFLLRFLFGVVSLCLVASANYVINEYLDAQSDKFHPTKKERVGVKLGLNPKLVYTEYALLIVAGLGLAWLCGKNFFFISVFLLIMGFFYNVKPFRTKDVAYLDVLSESVNNAIRLAMGWFLLSEGFNAAQVAASPDFVSPVYPVSSLIIGYWMGGAFLMAVKRYSEYRFIDDKSTASLYRKSFKHYTENSLLLSSIFYGMISLFFVGIFIIKYRIEYIILIPFIAVLFCWYLWLGMKEDSVAQKPEKLYKQWKLFAFLLLMAAIGVVLSFVDIPVLDVLY